ncbi:MAG: quinolinate synthase NadA [archaeon]|nr:quinolinate synthase NadA [archaeon]
MHESIVFEKELADEAKRLYVNLKHLEYSMNECLMFAPLTLKINKLKKEKNAVILAHNYQRPEILFGIADFTGDSFALSKNAMETNADIILFCGVKFMAETAKILNPEKKVLIPSLEAGCSLADEITAQDVKNLRSKYPNLPVITYINTPADVKAESDVICTSANALKVIEAMKEDEVIFVPDMFMARNLQNQTKKKIHYWNGKCIVHEQFTPEQVTEYKNQFPEMKVLAHLECMPEVIALSDLAGGTSDMYNYIKNSDAEKFMLVTECGMSDLLRARFPEKQFINPCSVCPYMKKIHLDNTLVSLEEEKFEITVEKEIAEKAKKALDRMIEIGK